jgi:hypothetical protein
MLKISSNFLEYSFQNFEPWIFLVLQSDLMHGLKCLENKSVPNMVAKNVDT